MFDNNNFNNDQAINDKINEWQDYVNEHGDEIKKAGRKFAAAAGLAIAGKVVATGMILIGIPVIIHKINKMDNNSAHQLANDMFD